MGIIDGLIGGYMDAKNRARLDAHNHLRSLSDQISVMEQVCKNTASCSNCKYGSSPSACEYNAMIDLFNETLDNYASHGLAKKG